MAPGPRFAQSLPRRSQLGETFRKEAARSSESALGQETPVSQAETATRVTPTVLARTSWLTFSLPRASFMRLANPFSIGSVIPSITRITT